MGSVVAEGEVDASQAAAEGDAPTGLPIGVQEGDASCGCDGGGGPAISEGHIAGGRGEREDFLGVRLSEIGGWGDDHKALVCDSSNAVTIGGGAEGHGQFITRKGKAQKLARLGRIASF